MLGLMYELYGQCGFVELGYCLPYQVLQTPCSERRSHRLCTLAGYKSDRELAKLSVLLAASRFVLQLPV